MIKSVYVKTRIQTDSPYKRRKEHKCTNICP